MARTLLILGLFFMVYCLGYATGFGLCARMADEECKSCGRMDNGSD